MKLNCLDNLDKNQKDVIIATVPFTDSSIPLMAPAALKPIVEKVGMTCLAIDLNAEIFNMIKQDPLKDDLISFFFDEVTTDQTSDWLNDMFTSITEQMLSWKPKIVCLSVFSYVCQHATKWLAYYIKKYDPTIKIYIGGAGCLDTFTGPSKFAGDLIKAKLVDYHVRGDGEHSLYELLKGNSDFLGINSLEWKELTNNDLSMIPIPDYTDYAFDVYEKKVLPLIGSRGCVRRCTFCDYIANWKKFQWRTAEHIFEEMKYQHKKYGIKYFKFQDSLTNGNQKEFRKLCELLAEYNNHNEIKFKWSGYYIFREYMQSSDQDWKLVYESGAENLVVGIENLNEDIRYAIGKKFSNKSIDLHLEQALKYNIQLQLLNIVGYVNETEEHIQFTKKWLDTHVKYKDIVHLQWGGTLGIFPNTYLEQNKEQLGVIMIGQKPQLWVNPAINSTPELRAKWAKDLNDYSRKLGYRVFDDLDNHFILETLIRVE
jgi:radical SAM superfamily enzyme YgiQ (UPF0313 family)